MSFVIISHAPLSVHNGKMYTYGPYGNEINIWLRHVAEVVFVCPLESYDNTQLLVPLDLPKATRHLVIPDFNLISWKGRIGALPAVVVCLARIFQGMLMATHIHLRTPGNIGALGCFLQMFFPWKKKTAKYAGNWDWKSKQPASYRMQQKILRSTILTHNMKVLVYGNWPHISKNILPFFTATYSERDIVDTPPRTFSGKIQLMFVGALVAGKQPMRSVQALKSLKEYGIDAHLHVFGNGPFFRAIQDFVKESNLENQVTLHGNQPSSVVKQYFQQSHFLIFISKSEGWPKVVAESMFWGCLPITTAVSCVPEMVNYGERGTIVEQEAGAVEDAVFHWLKNEAAYVDACKAAMIWSRKYTLEKFESEITKLL